MKHFFALIAVITSVLVGAAVVAPVAAGQQETPTGNVTMTGTPTASSEPVVNSTATRTPLTDEARAEPNLRLSPTIKLVRWRYDGSLWHVTLQASTPQAVTLTDAAQVAEALTTGSGKATGTANYRSYVLDPGTQTITFDASRFEGASAITVAPSGTEGQIAILRTEAFGDADTFVKQSTAGLLVLVAVSGTAIVTLRRVRGRLEDEDKGAERVL